MRRSSEQRTGGAGGAMQAGQGEPHTRPEVGTELACVRRRRHGAMGSATGSSSDALGPSPSPGAGCAEASSQTGRCGCGEKGDFAAETPVLTHTPQQ